MKTISTSWSSYINTRWIAHMDICMDGTDNVEFKKSNSQNTYGRVDIYTTVQEKDQYIFYYMFIKTVE